VRIERTDRSLAIGLCLYSCFRALNDTIADRFLHGYATLWSLLGMLAFFGSLCLWSWALWKSRTETATEENLLPLDVYQSFTPQINLQLRSLNDQLCKIWKPEVPRQ
jgi:cbb3-type cytochrome oxidase subunit 3